MSRLRLFGRNLLLGLLVMVVVGGFVASLTVGVVLLSVSVGHDRLAYEVIGAGVVWFLLGFAGIETFV